jgi:hypothetical protein
MVALVAAAFMLAGCAASGRSAVSSSHGPDYYYRSAKRDCTNEVAQSNLPPDVLHFPGGSGPIQECLRARGYDTSGNPIPAANAGTAGQAGSSGSPPTR